MQPPAPRDRASATSPFAREFGSVVDIVIAPARAFATIKESAPWRLAFVVTLALNLATVALQGAAIWHVKTVTDPGFHRLSALEAADAAKLQFFDQGLQAGLLPVWIAGLIAVGMTFSTPRTVLENRRLATFFSLALTAGIPSSIGDLCSAIATALRPAASYVSFAQLFTAFPDSLAAFAPHGTDVELLFLGNVDVFTIWSYLVMAFGYAALTGSSLNRALAVAFGCAFSVTVGSLFLLLQ